MITPPKWPEFSEQDTPDNLTLEKLTALSNGKHCWVLDYLERNSLFDVERIRVLMEMGTIEAKRRLQDMQR